MMKKRNVMLWTLLLFCYVGAAAQRGLKDVLGNYFLMGAALNTQQTGVGCDSAVTAVICQHFNSIVAENCMKPEELQPQEGKFRWRKADRFVTYGEKHGMTVTGHVLVWHAQTPEWFFKDSLGHEASKELLTQRMRRHIHAVVGRYKGSIKGWDVVNEAIEDDGSYRQSPWYRILGPEYIEMAFRFAHEADPDAELYYNDYSMAGEKKREAVCRLVKNLKAKGLRIDGVGMQSHNGLDYPNLDEYEKSIDAFAACGVKVLITELDINVLPNPQGFGGADIAQNFELQQKYNPYTAGLPADKQKELNKRWMDLFKIYYKHRDQIGRVTLWGVCDENSWLNGWPIKGRTNYALLFDRQYQAKPVVNDIIKLFK
jgi:endo-1,4-beta-xylanase